MLALLSSRLQVLYLGEGYFSIHGIPVQVRRINLIGGGTGITPLWQVKRHAGAHRVEQQQQQQQQQQQLRMEEAVRQALTRTPSPLC